MLDTPPQDKNVQEKDLSNGESGKGTSLGGDNSCSSGVILLDVVSVNVSRRDVGLDSHGNQSLNHHSPRHLLGFSPLLSTINVLFSSKTFTNNVKQHSP
jgi:hypothetical protein